MLAQEGRRTSQADSLPVMLIGGLFALLGLALFGVILLNLNATLASRSADDDAGQLILRFLNDYGIIVPLLLAGIGVYMINLSTRIFRRDANAAAWARQIMLWFFVGLVVLLVQAFFSGLTGAGGSFGRALQQSLPFVVAGAAIAAAWWWMGQHNELFVQNETLGESSARTAWNLLIPTLVVLIVVAARPLEETFIASLTDQRFASGQEVNFVGLDNYAQLLGVRFDVIQCEQAEGGGCATNEAGELVFPRPRDVLDESYRDLRYRDVATISLGQSQLLLSARDRDFVNAISNTLLFTFGSVTLELILGLFIAMVINSKFPGRGLMRAAMLVPWAIPTVVSARLWEIMLRDNQSGVINHFLVSTGLLDSSQAWLANSSLQIPALVAIDVWKTTPFMALILLAGLQVIPSDIYEAADVDGASRIRQFFNITIPLLRPTIAVALVFRTLDAVRVFDVFQVLLGRQQLSMATYNYETLVQSQQLGYASAIGVLIFAIILIFTVIYVRILGVSAE